MHETIRREELYAEVWSVPLSTLCEKFGLSDNGLRKVCRRLNVPVPPRGYWAKIEAGQRVPRAPLPGTARHTFVRIHRQPKPVQSELDDRDAAWLAERKQYEADPAHAISVVLKPRRWHEAVAPLHEFFELEVKEVLAAKHAHEAYEKWPDWRKRRDMCPDRMKWLWVSRAGELIPATHKPFAARLSMNEFRRALAILNTLAIALTRRGFTVAYDGQKGRLPVVGHGGEMELRMSEATDVRMRKVKRFDGKMEDERYRVPTGRLRLYVARGYGLEKMFEESVTAPLETRLNVVCLGVANLVVKCREKIRSNEARESREAELAAERAILEQQRWEEAHRIEAEKRRRDALMQEAAAWQQAAEIRAYVEAVQRSVGAAEADGLAAWAQWAHDVAADMDPMRARLRAASGA